MKTVEDCIEILAGIQAHEGTFSIDRSDYNLINSLARQTFRGTAYTDRQHELAKQKIISYRTQFESNGYDIDIAIKNIRLPIRSIDRSRWVKLVDHQGPDKVYESDKSPFIAVRFIFQKKLISNIEAIKNSLGEGDYDKENKIHYFPFSERAVYEIVSNFNESNGFDVESELGDYYKKLDHMNNNKKDYIPGIYNLKLKNLHNKNLSYALSTIGEPNIDNLSQYYDQRARYGLEHFDTTDIDNSLKTLTPLSKRIVQRKKYKVLVNPNEFTIDNLAESMLELYRFPLLIVLNDKDCYNELVSYQNAFNGIIPNESCSVMFRLENNNEGIEFNQYIQRHNLNNLVDNSTKIVYISNSKLPKPLVKNEWKPSAAISTHSSYGGRGSKVDTFIDSLDLVLYYEDQVSPWKRNSIEKI